MAHLNELPLFPPAKKLPMDYGSEEIPRDGFYQRGPELMRMEKAPKMVTFNDGDLPV